LSKTCARGAVFVEETRQIPVGATAVFRRRRLRD
jgi:hypothetical protein